MRLGDVAVAPSLRVVVGVLACLLLYVPVVPSLVHEWATFPSLSHGFVVPVLALYLAWARRAHLARGTVEPSCTGFPIFVMGLAWYVVGMLSGESFVTRTSLMITLAGTVWFLAGAAITRGLFPAIAYLGLMIPLPYVTVRGLTDQLRIIEATTSAQILTVIGVPVFQDGFFLHLANMTLEVADVCSSIPAVMSLVALGAAFGCVTQRPPLVRLTLILMAAPLGFVSNIVRITMTAAGTYYVGPMVLESVFHSWHGTLVFVMTVGALTLLDSGLSRLRSEDR